MTETIHAKIQKSPFKNVYWFSRYLLNTDQFGALGKQKELQLLNLVTVLENLITQENFSDDDKIILLKNTLSRTLVIEEFTKLIKNLSELNISHNKLDDNIMMTAFVQEFERKLYRISKFANFGI